jgi:TonB family protein
VNHVLLIHAYSNTVAAAALALLLVVAARWLRRPSILHLFWLIVLARLVAPAVIPIHLMPTPAPTRIEVAGTVAPLTAVPPQTDPTRGGFPVAEVLLGLWVLGAVATGSLAGVRLVRASRIVGRAKPAPAHLAPVVEQLAAELGTRVLPVRVTECAMPPSLWGLGLRPTIVLPERLVARLSPEQLRALIAHELTHAARRDHWIRWFELLVTTVHWWNPIAWWGRRQLQRAEERSCDARVVATFPDLSRPYAESLITTLRFLSTAARVPVPAATGMADLSEIQGRLTHIMKPTPTRPAGPLLRASLAAMALAAVVVSPLLTAAPPDNVPQILTEPITLHLEDAAVADFAANLEKIITIPVIDQTHAGSTVSLHVNEVSVMDMLDLMSRSNPLVWSFDGDAITIANDSPWKPDVEGTLDGAPVYRFKSVPSEAITEPKRLGGPNPEYPEAMRKEGISGLVVLEAVIDDTGRVRALEVLKSADPAFSASAMLAVEQWTFEPAIYDGAPVSVRYNLTVRFNLQ